MALIRERQGRHFVDESGQMFWINGPEDFCYLSEQRQWRTGLSFDQVIEWKQCAPTGLVSQRFGSVIEACETFEQNRVVWSYDLDLSRMGEQMMLHRSLENYRPTYMKLAEAKGAPISRPPWIKSADNTFASFPGPRCHLPRPGKRVGLELAKTSPSLHPPIKKKAR